MLVHDWLTGMRGGEKVLESLCRLFPDAPIYTLVHVRGSVSALIERHPIRTSVIQQLPDPARRYRHYLPLFPSAIELFDFDDADMVISTSHCAAKAVVPTGRATHICYCHSPMRYAWDQFDQYFGRRGWGRWRAPATGRSWPGWPAGIGRPPPGLTGSSPTPVSLPAGSSGTIIGRLRFSTLRSIHSSSHRTARRPNRISSWCPRSYPYKRIDVAIQAAARLGVSAEDRRHRTGARSAAGAGRPNGEVSGSGRRRNPARDLPQGPGRRPAGRGGLRDRPGRVARLRTPGHRPGPGRRHRNRGPRRTGSWWTTTLRTPLPTRCSRPAAGRSTCRRCAPEPKCSDVSDSSRRSRPWCRRA